MRTEAMYPLVPKSTASLCPGQYWAVPLANGRFACGRVVQVGCSTIPTPSRAFFGGLHAWVGAAAPSTEGISGNPIVAWGVMHIRAITKLGGQILGERALDLDGITPPSQLSAMGGPDAQFLSGAEPVRPATHDEWGKLPVLGFWGYDFIKQLAEERLASSAGGAA